MEVRLEVLEERLEERRNTGQNVDVSNGPVCLLAHEGWRS